MFFVFVLPAKDDEILDLRSQLDKFRSVAIFVHQDGTQGQQLQGHGPRKQRAWGISGEPQVLTSIGDVQSNARVGPRLGGLSNELIQRHNKSVGLVTSYLDELLCTSNRYTYIYIYIYKI